MIQREAHCKDYLDIMGGLDSSGYAYFKKLFKEGFEAARKHSDSLLSESVSLLAKVCANA